MSNDPITGEIPPKVQLNRLALVRAKELGGVLAAKVKEISGKDIGTGFTAINEESPSFSLGLGQADHVRVDSLIHSSGEGWVELDLLLFRDGSPYMRDEDLDEFGDNAREYELWCLPESPPFLVHSGRVGRHLDEPVLESVRRYLNDVREGKQRPPHYLTDDEAVGLAEVITIPVLESLIDVDEALQSTGWDK